MNRKVIKVISIVLMMLMVVAVLMSSVYAVPEVNTNIFDNVKADTGTTNTVSKIMATIINVIQIVGMGVAIIMLVYVAIKYMSAAPSDKADFKKSATGYIVGAVVLFAASGILQLVKNFATTTINT